MSQRILVNEKNLVQAHAEIVSEKFLSFDTETTGLYPWERLNGSRPNVPFLLVIGSAENTWAFDLRVTNARRILDIFSMKEKIIFAHNAKFDLHMLFNWYKWENPTWANIHDTMVMHRLIRNDLFNYSLDAVAKHLLGEEKDKAVEEFINHNKLYTHIEIDGKKEKLLHFDRVPMDIMVKYAFQDAELTYKIGIKQCQIIKKEIEQGNAALRNLYVQEAELTKVCYAMEKKGISINEDYCKKSIVDLHNARVKISDEFKALTKLPLVDSRVTLEKAFKAEGRKIHHTEKGNTSFSSDVLETYQDSKVANLILRSRDYLKRESTYFRNFIHYSDKNGAIHAGIKQSGTASGRMSYSEPNLQNLNKEESGEFQIRKAFIPRKGHIFVMIDFKAMEYRLMLDMAARHMEASGLPMNFKMIDEIKAGMDVHEATAQMMGVERQYAKTLNFMLLYGGGNQKLADALGIDLDQATRLKNQYFEALPEVKQFIKAVSGRAQRNGKVRSRFGRTWYFQKDFAYKAPNYLIQGSCADIVKKAMIDCHKLLDGSKSAILVQIHDEILFEMHLDDLHLVPELASTMSSSYEHSFLPMGCDIEWSDTSWGDKRKWYDYESNKTGAAAR